MGQDDVRREGSQFCGVFTNFGGIGSWPNGSQFARFGRCSSPLAAILAKTPRTMPEIPHHPRSKPGYADPPHALGLLRMNRERPSSGKASNRFDEFAPSHCRPREHVLLIAKPSTLD